MSRTVLQIFLEGLGLGGVGKADGDLAFPRRIVSGVGTLSGVVLVQPLLQIAGQADVFAGWIGNRTE
jgi:hypothetical protein